MQLGMIGLGRMGSNMVRRLLKDGQECMVFDRSPNLVHELDTLEPNDRFLEAVNKLPIARGIPYHSIIGDRADAATHRTDPTA